MMKLNKIVESAQNKVHGMTRYKSIARGAWCMAASLLALSTLPSCSDDLSLNNSKENLNEGPGITLLIPNTENFTSKASGQTSPVEGNEGNINTLHLYLFGEDGYVYKDADLSSITPTIEGEYKKYKIDEIEAGSYYAFVTANIDSYLNSDAKNQLKSSELSKGWLETITLNFSSSVKLAGNNLPMACLNTEIEEANGGKITVGNTDLTIHAPLKFLCSKVRLTVLFNSENGGISTDFEDKSFDVLTSGNNTKPIVSKLISQTPILYDASKGQSPLYNTNWDLSLAQYKYPDSGDNYPRYLTAQSKPEDNLTVAWDNNSKKKAWQGIIYIPENLSSTRTTITLTGQTEGNSKTSQKTIDIAPADATREAGNKRGFMYDIVTKVTTYAPTDWPIEVSVYNWQETVYSADFVHTFLELERTTASVTSLMDDIIGFNSDGRGGFTLDCINPSQLTHNGVKITTPVIILGEVDEEEHTLTLSVNSELNVNDIDGQGLHQTATCYIHAGNITKRIDVEYDLSPMFEVDPISLTFNWGDKVDGTIPSQQFRFETNLGGIKLFKSDANGTKGTQINNNSVTANAKIDITDTASIFYLDGTQEKTDNSVITLKCDKTDTSEGYITVTSTSSGLKHVAHHYFWAEPETMVTGVEGKLLMVSVIPDQGSYRVYFRAINDYQDNGGYFLGDSWGNYNDEDYNEGSSTNSTSNNWIDWWNGSNNDYSSNVMKPKNHKIYIYGQIGETGTQFDNLQNYGETWQFNYYEKDDAYNSETNSNYKNSRNRYMNGDYKNPGWYFSDLNSSLPQWIGNAHTITPGSTLFIFHTAEGSHHIHRCSHHNDPGIPLFNYEDREGWYLYDPTREPYYNTYDDKPVIEDIIYEFYTPGKPTEWYRNYGVSSGNSSYDSHGTYTIKGKITESTSNTTALGYTYKSSSSNYYRTRIKFKCPKGEYGKALKVKYMASGGTQYVYARNETGWTDKMTPQVQFYSGGTYSSIYTMSSCDTPSGRAGDKWYSYEVPSQYANWKVKFFQQEDSQHNNIWDGGEELNGRNAFVYLKWEYKDGRNQCTTWYEYENNGIETTVTLMGGNSYTPTNKVIQAYFNGTKWVQGKPSGY